MNELWAPRRRIEQEYRNSIRQTMRKVQAVVLGIDDPFEIITRIHQASQSPWMERFAQSLALRMVTHLFNDNARTWREAARKSSKGRRIWVLLQEELRGPLGPLLAEQIQRNAEFIKSVPADMARQMTQHVMSRQVAGLRYTDIAAQLLDMYPHISDVKANLIARTETAKTATALTQGRAQLLGINWYRWRTSEDSRVRDSHKHMDKVLVSWDEPPSPEELDHEKSYGHYHAGCTFNCRCAAQPLIDFDYVTWPARVYIGGRIVSMNKAEFERIIQPQRISARAM